MTALRIRSIKPALWLDEKLGVLPVGARLLFIGLIGHADDDGLLRAAPAVLRGQVFPYDEDVSTRDVSGWLQQLHTARIIDLYGPPSGQQYARIANWHKHQRINKPRKSDLPMVSPHCPIRERGGKQELPPDHSRQHVQPPVDARAEGIGEEGKGREREVLTDSSALSADAEKDTTTDELFNTDAIEHASASKVFDAWRRLFGRNANTKLDDKRRKRIKWAVQEYGRVAVWQVLQGYASDPWRHETNSRHDVKALLKDAAAIERGLELYEKSKGRSTSTGPAVDELAKAGY